MRFAAALALAALMPAPAVADAATDAAAAVNAFYTVYGGVAAQGGGIPDAAARARYAAVLSPALSAQVAAAAAAQDRLTAKVKNAVPPMLQGDIFSSLFEGATGWKVGACTSDGRTARCPVALTHAVATPPGARPEKPAHWNDIILLTATPQGWKVNDVVYDAGFAFGNTGTLGGMLRMVVAANP